MAKSVPPRAKLYTEQGETLFTLRRYEDYPTRASYHSYPLGLRKFTRTVEGAKPVKCHRETPLSLEKAVNSLVRWLMTKDEPTIIFEHCRKGAKQLNEEKEARHCLAQLQSDTRELMPSTVMAAAMLSGFSYYATHDYCNGEWWEAHLRHRPSELLIGYITRLVDLTCRFFLSQNVTQRKIATTSINPKGHPTWCSPDTVWHLATLYGKCLVDQDRCSPLIAAMILRHENKQVAKQLTKIGIFSPHQNVSHVLSLDQIDKKFYRHYVKTMGL